jgi:RNA polymerase sigma-32 factor
MTTLNLPVPVASSLENYIVAVNGIPMLTHERELELGKRLKYEDDLEAARELVLSHLRLVVSIARHYMGYGLPQADLIQEGNIGLMKAVKRFDPERGVRLVSFAVHWIRAEIHEFILKNWRMVKIATTKAQRKLFFNLRSMKTNLGTLNSNEVKEMAETLGVKPEEVVEMETRLQGQDVPLEAGPDDNEDWVSPIAYLSDPSAEPSRLLETEESQRRGTDGLELALSTLDPRSRRIIESRWLKDDSSVTLHELADEFGVSAERIRQIEVKAMQKMRELLAATA